MVDSSPTFFLPRPPARDFAVIAEDDFDVFLDLGTGAAVAAASIKTSSSSSSCRLSSGEGKTTSASDMSDGTSENAGVDMD